MKICFQPDKEVSKKRKSEGGGLSPVKKIKKEGPHTPNLNAKARVSALLDRPVHMHRPVRNLSINYH